MSKRLRALSSTLAIAVLLAGCSTIDQYRDLPDVDQVTTTPSAAAKPPQVAAQPKSTPAASPAVRATSDEDLLLAEQPKSRDYSGYELTKEERSLIYDSAPASKAARPVRPSEPLTSANVEIPEPKANRQPQPASVQAPDTAVSEKPTTKAGSEEPQLAAVEQLSQVKEVTSTPAHAGRNPAAPARQPRAEENAVVQARPSAQTLRKVEPAPRPASAQPKQIQDPVQAPDRVAQAQPAASVPTLAVAKSEPQQQDVAAIPMVTAIADLREALSGPIAAAMPAIPEEELKEGTFKTEQEQEATKLVQGSHQAEKPEGGVLFLKGKEVKGLSFESAGLDTIRRNLAIEFQKYGHQSALAGVVAADAAFDPIVDVGINWTRRDDFERIKKITRLRPLVDEDDVNLISSIIVDGEEISSKEIFVKGGFETNTEDEFANQVARNQTASYSLGVTQNIRWGAVAKANVTTDYFMVSVPRNDQQRPFTADFSCNLTVPVPWFKDWGPYGSLEAAEKLARAARDRAYWTLETAINNSLLSTNLAYWEVIRAAQRLLITSEIRKNLEKIAGQADEKLKAGRAVAYEQFQARRALSSILGQEQNAWADYVRASNALVSILDYDRKVVVLPEQYVAALNEVREVREAEALQLALDANPDIKGSMVDLRLARINHKLQCNQARPSFNFVTGLTLDQDNSVYGYTSFYTAWKNIINTDKQTAFAGFNFSIPWGNEPAYARRYQAEQQLLQAEKSLNLTRNNVGKKVQDALSALKTTRQRVLVTYKNQQASQKVFDTILDFWEKGRVVAIAEGKSYPAFEILERNNALLSAKLSHIDAKVQFKQAEEQLLAAQGLLKTRMPEFKVRVEVEKKEVQPPPAKAESKEQQPKPATQENAEQKGAQP